MKKEVLTGKIMIWCIILFLLLGNSVAYPEQVEGLKPTLNVKDIKPSSDYFGLEIKWSVEKSMGSGVSAKVTYMDPEVFLAYINYEAEEENWSSQEEEKKKKEVLNLLEKYLIFKVFLKHPDDPDYTRITNWQIFLIDDFGDRYLPEKIEEGKAELRRGFAGPYYGRISFIYFSKYSASNGKPVLDKNTRWIKIEFSQSSNKSNKKEFKWDFFLEGKERRSSYYFYPYLKVSLVILLILLIFLVWVTRPTKARGNI